MKNGLNIMFRLPETPKARVLWQRKGVMYQSVIPTPRDNYGLRDFMACHRHVGMSEIRAVQPMRETTYGY